MANFIQYDTLVLSGGGTKGFLHLGAVQCALDMNLIHNVKTYIGTSVGSIINYLLAIGYTPMELMVEVHLSKLFEKVPGVNLVAMINGNGAISFNILMEALEKLTLEKIGRFVTLGDLKKLYGKTLICTTYNMTTSQLEYLSPDTYPDIPCLTAIKMSSNLPLVFERFKYMDSYYIDGGIAEHFPILQAEQWGEHVLGINNILNPQTMKDTPDTGIVDYLIKILQIQGNYMIKEKIKLATPKSTIVCVTTGDLRNPMDFNMKTKSMLDLFSLGYEQFRNFMEK